MLRFSASALGLAVLFSPLFFLSAFLGPALLLFLVFSPLLFVVTLTLLSLFLPFRIGRGCNGRDGRTALPLLVDMYRAIVVRAFVVTAPTRLPYTMMALLAAAHGAAGSTSEFSLAVSISRK